MPPPKTVPINDTTFGNGAVSNEGWIYSTMDDIFRVWEPANGCDGSEVASHWATPLDGVQELYCWGKRCKNAPVIRCAWHGGHNYYANDGAKNSELVWNFLSRFTRETHLGLGKTSSSTGYEEAKTRAAAAQQALQQVEAKRIAMDAEREKDAVAVAAEVPQNTSWPWQSHCESCFPPFPNNRRRTSTHPTPPHPTSNRRQPSHRVQV